MEFFNKVNDFLISCCSIQRKCPRDCVVPRCDKMSMCAQRMRLITPYLCFCLYLSLEGNLFSSNIEYIEQPADHQNNIMIFLKASSFHQQ